MFITFHSPKFGKRKSAETTGFTLTNEQFDRLFETRGKRTRDDDDDDFDVTAADRVAKRLRSASEKAFRSGALVHLGALRSPQDVGYSYGSDSFTVAVNSKATLSAQLKIKNPESWSDFLLLFNRLIVGYVASFPQFHKKFLSYIERLQQYVELKIASPSAMIEYDRRIRSEHCNYWLWLEFDTQMYEVCKFLFPFHPNFSQTPLSRAYPSSKSKGPHSSSQSPPSLKLCRDWVSGTCAQKRASCRFAHHCVNAKCVQAGSTAHKPGDPGCLP